MSQFKKETGLRIRHYRKKVRLSQGELADRIGMSLTGLQNYERGHRSPSLETAVSIANACHIHVSKLVPSLRLIDPATQDEPVSQDYKESDCSFHAVMRRLKETFGASTDKGLANEMGVSPQTLATWKSRLTIPYRAITEVAKNKNLSLDHLLLGRAQQPAPAGDQIREQVIAVLREMLDAAAGQEARP